jgi:hypothetical protein
VHYVGDSFDFSGKNLTPYGGLLPVATMLEKLGFQALMEETVTVSRMRVTILLFQDFRLAVLRNDVLWSDRVRLLFRLSFRESYGNLPNIWRALQLDLVWLDRGRREEGRIASARWAFDPSSRQLQMNWAA